MNIQLLDMKKSTKKERNRNYVAKNMNRFNKPKRIDDKTKYKRTQKRRLPDEDQ